MSMRKPSGQSLAGLPLSERLRIIRAVERGRRLAEPRLAQRTVDFADLILREHTAYGGAQKLLVQPAWYWGVLMASAAYYMYARQTASLILFVVVLALAVLTSRMTMRRRIHSARRAKELNAQLALKAEAEDNGYTDRKEN